MIAGLAEKFGQLVSCLLDRLVVRAASQIAAEEVGGRPFAALVPPGIRAVGVKGDERHYGRVVIVKVSPYPGEEAADFYKVIEELSNRLTNEIDEVGRVVLDITRLRG